LPQLAILEHFTVNLHKSLIGALSFNYARHRQLRQHAVTTSASLSAVFCRFICCFVFHCLLSCGGAFLKFLFLVGWLCKLFDKPLVCGLACGALAMCLQMALAYYFISFLLISSFDLINFSFSLPCFVSYQSLVWSSNLSTVIFRCFISSSLVHR